MVEGTGSPVRPLYRAGISLMTELPPKALPSNYITFRIRISTCKFEGGGEWAGGGVGVGVGRTNIRTIARCNGISNISEK